MSKQKIILAYSGGLDKPTIIKVFISATSLKMSQVFKKWCRVGRAEDFVRVPTIKICLKRKQHYCIKNRKVRILCEITWTFSALTLKFLCFLGKNLLTLMNVVPYPSYFVQNPYTEAMNID